MWRCTVSLNGNVLLQIMAELNTVLPALARTLDALPAPIHPASDFRIELRPL